MPTFRRKGRVGSAAAAGTANYLRATVVAIASSAVASLRTATIGAAVTIERLVATLTTPVTPALAFSQTVAGTATRTVAPTVATTAVATMQAANLASAFEIVQAKYDLTATRGASTATSVGPNAFTNPTNAQGLANGTLASGAGNALGARTYQLNLAYPAITGKDELTITAAELRFYISQTGTALNNGGMTIGWSSTSRAYAQTNAFPADVNYLTTPLVVPVTGVPLTWAEMASIVARVNHVTAALNTSTANVDAVHLVVTATRTDTL